MRSEGKAGLTRRAPHEGRQIRGSEKVKKKPFSPLNAAGVQRQR